MENIHKETDEEYLKRTQEEQKKVIARNRKYIKNKELKLKCGNKLK
jgi:hypothetical protein